MTKNHIEYILIIEYRKELRRIKIKNIVSLVIGALGTVVVRLIGKPSNELLILLLLMTIDILVGFIVSAVWHKSTKTKTGRLSSRAMFKGIVKKVLTLVIVIIAYQLDNLLGQTVIRHITIIALITEESLSVIETIALTGVRIPAIITSALDVLEKGVKNEQLSNRH